MTPGLSHSPKFLPAALALIFFGASPLHARTWLPFGPDGGDARRLAPDPRDHAHLFLGTANGWIYESHNAGATWTHLAQVGKRDDLVLDSILVDASNSKHLIVGAWVIDHHDGGIYNSFDGGVSWTNQAEMRGQSVLALAASISDPKTLVAGTLDGVFRSADGGNRWHRISPAGSTEIHEVQSVAIDPQDPTVVYAGTWHLPWKTVDGGEHWHNITKEQGIIDDSDVFSIIVDPSAPQNVFASACSGIYKSEDFGQSFNKIKGIPNSARRTRRLLQDPAHLDTVFAGTTEGLYRSADNGKTWVRTTGPEIIVNDVSIDSGDPHHVLIATDRGGVLASDDGGDTFHPSNTGFSARQITALQQSTTHPATLFVGVVNDKDWGGVFQSDNGGLAWTQRSAGLEGRDVFSLGQALDGTLIAGTSHGLYRLDATAQAWQRVEEPPGLTVPAESVKAIVPRPPVTIRSSISARREPARPLTAAQRKAAVLKARHKPAPKRVATKKSARSTKKKTLVAGKHPGHRGPVVTLASARAPRPLPPPPAVAQAPSPARPSFDGAVYAIANVDHTILAATSAGLLTSTDDGVTWLANGPRESVEWRFLAASNRNALAASLRTVVVSTDAGLTWNPLKLPETLTQVSAVAIEPSGEIWLGGREGLFVSSDSGTSWTTPKNLALNSVNNIFFDPAANRMVMTTAGNASLVFTVQLPGKEVNFTDTGWNLRFARPMGDHLVAVTLYDGLVVQPRVVPAPTVPALENPPPPPAPAAPAPAPSQP